VDDQASPPGRYHQVQRLLHRREITYPPRLFDLPTGTLLPSLGLHASRGWSFGFSDNQDAHRWVLSLGLGGLGEALISSSRIIHLSDRESHPLAGFRLRLPVGRFGGRLAERLSMTLNIAATATNDFTQRGAFTAADGMQISDLSYEHRETTLGLSGTWHSDPIRFHVIVHATDQRIEEIRFCRGSACVPGGDQKETYLNLGIGVDYAARPNTLLLVEMHTAPRMSFAAHTRRLDVEHIMEYAAGLRFFPTPLLGFDAIVSCDSEAAGLADLKLGCGLHLMLGRN
jgi:hypothetical protein